MRNENGEMRNVVVWGLIAHFLRLVISFLIPHFSLLIYICIYGANLHFACKKQKKSAIIY